MKTAKKLTALAVAAVMILSSMAFAPLTVTAQRVPGLVDFWDFGINQRGAAVYNNMFDANSVNDTWNWESINEPGIDGTVLTGFTSGDLTVGLHNNGRLRTPRTDVRRFDDNVGSPPEEWYLPGEEPGRIHLNGATQNANRFVVINNNNPFDVLRFYVRVENTDNEISIQHETGGEFNTIETRNIEVGFSVIEFVAPEAGNFRILAADSSSRISYYRITRTAPVFVTLTGNITAPETLPADYGIVFTNTVTGTEHRAVISGTIFTLENLPGGFDYYLSLENALAFVITGANPISVPAEPAPTAALTIESVELARLSGRITGLSAEALAAFEPVLTVPEGYIFRPVLDINRETGAFTAYLEAGISYPLTVLGINDWQTTVTEITARTRVIPFTLKPRHLVTITAEGLPEITAADLSFTFTFAHLPGIFEEYAHEQGYTYTFAPGEPIMLRDGFYTITAGDVPDDFEQRLTPNIRIEGAPAAAAVGFRVLTPPEPVPYRAVVRVGALQEFQTINDALAYINRMGERTTDQRVTVEIDPGNYEEMLNITQNYITLTNSHSEPSLNLYNGGVDINDRAVRITSYYGHGMHYFSMGQDFMFCEETLAVNLANGYRSVDNPGGAAATHWNATVVVRGTDFRAYGIIFENSFQQYVSARELQDRLELAPGNQGGLRPATLGDTGVQARPFRERAAALAIANGADRAYFENVRFVGRQDTLYGGNARAAFNNVIVMGSVDPIFGPMSAVFYNSELQFNTDADADNDIAVFTAAQQPEGRRGFLFLNSRITSTTPGIDTASATSARPGHFGRPWAGATSETVFVNTTIEASEHPLFEGQSLITPEGWRFDLGGVAPVYEYGTTELSGEDNSARREPRAITLDSPFIGDVELIPFNFTRTNADGEDDGWNPIG